MKVKRVLYSNYFNEELKTKLRIKNFDKIASKKNNVYFIYFSSEEDAHYAMKMSQHMKNITIKHVQSTTTTTTQPRTVKLITKHLPPNSVEVNDLITSIHLCLHAINAVHKTMEDISQFKEFNQHHLLVDRLYTEHCNSFYFKMTLLNQIQLKYKAGVRLSSTVIHDQVNHFQHHAHHEQLFFNNDHFKDMKLSKRINFQSSITLSSKLAYELIKLTETILKLFFQLSMAKYQSHTLHEGNRQRLLFLPCFPIHTDEETLLLSNVPVTMLTPVQLQYRQMGTFQQQFQYIENNKTTGYVPSFIKFIHKNFIVNLSTKLNMDQSIIDYNLKRLDELTRKSVLNSRHHSMNFSYHMHEWPMALEIFLQIDVDSFFLKTCAYRGSHPRMIHGTIEGVFCIDPPDTRYYMFPCTDTSCACCYQSLSISCRPEPSVRFAFEQAHRCVNGYQIYLNCHVTCKTKNFIYVLTCPCGQFDFIGTSHDTNESFKDVLLNHRRQSVRILHEFLLGEKIIQRTLDMYEREKTIDEKKADTMYLYQHLTECSAAFQLLLNRCGHYWCFIPMNKDEADQEDDQFLQIISKYDWSPHERTDAEVQWCLKNLPSIPTGTRFSLLQVEKQTIFLKNGSDLLFLPPRHLDIFNMNLIFVLPDDCSQLLCHVMESLLITHAECKLNTNGHVFKNESLLSTIPKTSHPQSWFKNLIGRAYK